MAFLLNISLLSPDIFIATLALPSICISQKMYPEAIVNVVLHYFL